MTKSQIGGVFICLATFAAAVFFMWGIVIHNYWAIAIPVIIACVAVLGVAFWLGWTMVGTEEAKPQPPQEAAAAPDEKSSEPSQNPEA
jgi:hypothetical protein